MLNNSCVRIKIPAHKYGSTASMRTNLLASDGVTRRQLPKFVFCLQHESHFRCKIRVRNIPKVAKVLRPVQILRSTSAASVSIAFLLCRHSSAAWEESLPANKNTHTNYCNFRLAHEFVASTRSKCVPCSPTLPCIACSPIWVVKGRRIPYYF